MLLDVTALMWSSIKGHTNIVCALLNHDDVDVNLHDEVGDTALS
jgi:ankyrin repeat protein